MRKGDPEEVEDAALKYSAFIKRVKIPNKITFMRAPGPYCPRSIG